MRNTTPKVYLELKKNLWLVTIEYFYWLTAQSKRFSEFSLILLHQSQNKYQGCTVHYAFLYKSLKSRFLLFIFFLLKWLLTTVEIEKIRHQIYHLHLRLCWSQKINLIKWLKSGISSTSPQCYKTGENTVTLWFWICFPVHKMWVTLNYLKPQQCLQLGCYIFGLLFFYFFGPASVYSANSAKLDLLYRLFLFWIFKNCLAKATAIIFSLL